MKDNVQDIKNLEYTQSKFLIPHDSGKSSRGSVLYLLSPTNTVQSIVTSKVFNVRGYRYYYMDSIVKIRNSKNKQISVSTKQDRNRIYSTNDEKVLSNSMSISSIGNENFIYNISNYILAFFGNNDIKKITTAYVKRMVDSLDNAINNSIIDKGVTKRVLIDINGWDSLLNNPAIMILYALVYDDTVLKGLPNDIYIYDYSGGFKIDLSKMNQKSKKDFITIINSTLKCNLEYDSLEDQLVSISRNTGTQSNSVDKLAKSSSLNKSMTKLAHVDPDGFKQITDRLNAVVELEDTFNEFDDTIFQNNDINPSLDKVDIASIDDTLMDEGIDIDETEFISTDGETDSDIDIDAFDFPDEIKGELAKIHTSALVGRTTEMNKRDEELRLKQQSLKFENKEFNEYFDISDVLLEGRRIDDIHLDTPNENIKTVKFTEFNKVYNEKFKESDILDAFTSLNDKNLAVYVTDITKEDTSDELTLKDTYKVKLKDIKGLTHSISVDIPKPFDNDFFYINGNYKIIDKQFLLKPISKTGEDVVQICTSYKKIFLNRHGSRLSSKMERFLKVMTNPNERPNVFTCDFSNNINTNRKYKSIIEYDELSKTFGYIDHADFKLVFNMTLLLDELNELGIDVPTDTMPIGYFKKENIPILISYDTQSLLLVDVNKPIDIIDFVLGFFDEADRKNFREKTVGKKYMFTRATIMKKKIPLIVLLGYCEGLTTILKKAGIKYRFSDTSPKKLKIDESTIKFADSYLIYENTPSENALLMNGLVEIPTANYNYSDFDDRDVYHELFYVIYGERQLGEPLITFYNFMIGPTDKIILQALDLPTGFVEVLLHGNALLSDNSYIRENNMNISRIRSNEIISNILYREIVKSYTRYVKTNTHSRPNKMGIPKNQIIKELLKIPTVEDYDILNPMAELSKKRTVSAKGLSGLNLDRAYTEVKRSYDSSMLGIVGMSTSPDANVGINRELTLEPNISSVRGFVDIKNDKVEDLLDANLFSPTELITPLSNTTDDSIRLAMAVKQTKHTLPVADMSPVLISNGVEQIVPYHVSTHFVNIAKDDGKVIDYDKDTNIVIVEYDNKEVEAIDLFENIVKNGGGGFYLENKKTTDLKVGDRFKKDQVLAHNEKFFSKNNNVVKINLGTFAKIAIMSSSDTFEDSSFITNKLAQRMSSEIIDMQKIAIGPNSNIEKIAMPGDVVNVGDTILSFDTSFEDGALNELLKNITDNDMKDEFKAIGKNQLKSAFTGVVSDVKIYCSVDLDDLSPSLRRIVSDYYNRKSKKKEFLNRYDPNGKIVKCGILLNEPTTKTAEQNGKIKGVTVNGGVLLEFYIKFKNTLTIGDKITFQSANKSIIGDIPPEGYEPFSTFRPDEEISSICGASAIIQRMTQSITISALANKVIVELKRAVADIVKNN